MENSNNNSSSSSDGSVGNTSATSSTEQPGENLDEEPSSSKTIHKVDNELETFRLQWKREIDSFPSKEHGGTLLKVKSFESIEDQAKSIFLRGIQAESKGKFQDAIALYRRAIQLVPDIEFRIDDNVPDYLDDIYDDLDISDSIESSDGEDEIEDLILRFQKIFSKIRPSRICEAKYDQKGGHISLLPPEIFLYILKWVVSQDLDFISLEQVSKVCRGFYICARDNELWRLICYRTWDINIDVPNRYGCWRNMFLQRPHLFFNGVYISKTTYVRYGESSFQDRNYRPCYLVEYYRYLRFFPEGVVLMLNTPDDPYQSLYKLRHKKSKHANVLVGRYKLVGNTVMAVVKKPKNENAVSSANYYRSRRQRQMVQEVQNPTFHLELEMKNMKKRLNCQLSWCCYSIHNVHRNGEESVSNFDIVPANFPSFWFSRVKSYTVESESPLQ